MFVVHIVVVCILSVCTIALTVTPARAFAKNVDAPPSVAPAESSLAHFEEHILQAIVEQTQTAPISAECAADLNVTYIGIRERQPWAIASEC